MRDHARLQALAATLPDGVRFGTSTWTYPGWRGLVYEQAHDPKRASAAMLEEYARFPLFGTVGIDSTYYAPPSAQTLADYARRLPPGFPCVSKVWSELTVHTFTKAQDARRAGTVNPHFLDPELFLEAVYAPYQEQFAGHTGPFIFEIQAVPAGRGRDAEWFAGELDRFFEALPRGVPYAVELRNREFLTPTYLAVLRQHDVAHVFNSWTRMPSIGEQLDLADAVTAPFMVSRALLKPGRGYQAAIDAFAPFDRIREPNPEVRADLVRLIEVAERLRLPAYLIVNNRLEGCSPLTIQAVTELWASRKDADSEAADGPEMAD